jgi:hypothetical protein
MNKEKILEMLKDLRRPETEDKPAPTVYEAFNVLIYVCEELVKSQKN